MAGGGTAAQISLRHGAAPLEAGDSLGLLETWKGHKYSPEGDLPFIEKNTNHLIRPTSFAAASRALCVMACSLSTRGSPMSPKALQIWSMFSSFSPPGVKLA